MVAAMRYTITFLGPFRVAAGASSDGLDETYHAANPLPSSSLKGLMRAHAQGVLEIDEPLVKEVFGSARTPSPWWWSDAVIAASPPAWEAHRVRTRVRIDPDTFTAADKAMQTAGELWPASAGFEVRQRGPLPSSGRLALHEAILNASARAITALGSDRRRGLGWVSIQSETPWDNTQQNLIAACRRNRA
jgi:CRISPR/Cas system CSM-associated protein Csm3 (group 7 of RAMP superfamily)